MNVKESFQIKDVEDSRDGPVASIAIVVRMPIARMPELIRMAADTPGAKVVYQRTSAGRLMIVEEEWPVKTDSNGPPGNR